MFEKKNFLARLKNIRQARKVTVGQLAQIIPRTLMRQEQFIAGCNYPSIKKEEWALLERIPAELLPAYQAAKEKNPENLQQIVKTFIKMAEDYHSLTQSLSK